MDISGETKLLAILADPVAQVQTPTLANKVLIELGQFGSFVLVPFHVGRQELPKVIDGLKHVQNFSGAVITMPHKVHTAAIIDRLSPEAELVGAVNTICKDKTGQLVGTTLDGEGFVSGLKSAGHQVKDKVFLLVGAGGAASAIAFALAKHGCAAIYLSNRTESKARTLKNKLQSVFPQIPVHTDIPKNVEFDVAINGTSLGMQPNDSLPISDIVLEKSHLVAECVIAPEMTQLLQKAQTQGKKIHTGTPMLSSQIRLMLSFMGVSDTHC